MLYNMTVPAPATGAHNVVCISFIGLPKGTNSACVCRGVCCGFFCIVFNYSPINMKGF